MKMCMVVLPKYDAARSATQLCLTTNSHSAVGEKTSADAHRQSSFLYVGVVAHVIAYRYRRFISEDDNNRLIICLTRLIKLCFKNGFLKMMSL